MQNKRTLILLGSILALALHGAVLAQEQEIPQAEPAVVLETAIEPQAEAAAAEEAKPPLEVKAPLYFCGNIKLCYLAIANSEAGPEVDSKVNDTVLANTLKRLTAYLPEQEAADIQDIYQREARICKRSGKTDDEFALMALAKYWPEYYADINTDVKYYNDYFLSLVQRTTILSGQGDYGDRETDVFNFDLANGAVLPLAGIFAAGTDYLGRLNTLANITPMERKRLAKKAKDEPVTEADLAAARKVKQVIEISDGQRYYVNNARYLVLLTERTKGRADYKDFRKCVIPLILLDEILKEELQLPSKLPPAVGIDAADAE